MELEGRYTFVMLFKELELATSLGTAVVMTGYMTVDMFVSPYEPVEVFLANAKHQYSLIVPYTSATDRIPVLLSWSPLARYTGLTRIIKLQ